MSISIELRKKLDDIVCTKNEKNWYVLELFLKNTVHQLPSQIVVQENPPIEEHNYNCFMYALGLNKYQSIIKQTKGFIYSPFVEHLINIGILTKKLQSEPGLIILYKNKQTTADQFLHSGLVMTDKKIISKWSWGPTLIHDVLDVPLSYGETISYYKLDTTKNIVDIYQKYKSYNV